MTLYLLFESAIGYALFQKLEFDEMNATSIQLQKAISKMESFSKMVRLKAFAPFHNAEKALTNALALADSKVSEDLKSFLELHLPQGKKNKKATLAVLDKNLAGNLSQEAGIEIQTGDVITELFRGIRTHFHDFLKNKEADIIKANLGLGHSFSRNRVSLDINRQDKHIIQSIAILDQLDKNLNTFSMRVKEWYSWHFPELGKQVTDNYTFIRLVDLIGNKHSMTEELIPKIEEIVTDGEIAKSIFESAKISMGQDLTEIDSQSISELCKRVLSQFEFRNSIQTYLKDRMKAVAPNLTSLIGENVGAKLISQAGSLISLAKYPASTVQILGAEKALFRALKTKGNTPKYGLLYHSSFISRAATKDKGKISRYVANKCSLAARIDQFLILPTDKFGEKMKKQVEERLKFLETGEAQTKNEDIMGEVLQELKNENLYIESEKTTTKKKDKKNKKKKAAAVVVEEEVVEVVKKPKRKAKEEVTDEEVIEVLPKKKKKVKTA